MDIRKNDKIMMDMILKILDLGQNDINSKEVVLNMIPEIYIAMPETLQKELITYFELFSKDATPMVRK